MEMDDLTSRWAIRGDPARLTEAAAALRGTRAEQIFGARFPGEYVMSGIARLLDSLAREMRESRNLSHDLVSAATELSEHVLAYLPKSKSNDKTARRRAPARRQPRDRAWSGLRPDRRAEAGPDA
jgi:hypothetical protein